MHPLQERMKNMPNDFVEVHELPEAHFVLSDGAFLRSYARTHEEAIMDAFPDEPELQTDSPLQDFLYLTGTIRTTARPFNYSANLPASLFLEAHRIPTRAQLDVILDWFYGQKEGLLLLGYLTDFEDDNLIKDWHYESATPTAKEIVGTMRTKGVPAQEYGCVCVTGVETCCPHRKETE